MRKGQSRIIRLPDIDPHIPLQDQLTAHLRGLILSGGIAPGARLPAQRALARELKLSRNTILHAYEALKAEGLLDGKTGAGTFVARQPSKEKSLRRMPLETRSLPSLLPLHQGVPDLSLFPLAEWTRLQNRRWRSLPPNALAYGPPAGWPGLRFILSQRLAAIRGIKCTPEQIHIVPSTVAAIRLASIVTGLSGKRVFVESPGYAPARAALESAGTVTKPLPVDTGGADVARATQDPNAAAVYLTPSCQFPTGYSLSSARRATIKNWAKETNGWILEDDYESDFVFEGAAPPPLFSESSRVIYFASLNQLLFPGLRLAFLVAPDALVDRFTEARATIDPHSDIPRQMVTHDFLEAGYLAAHIRRCREVYAERRETLRDALTSAFGDSIALSPQPMGLHVTARLPPGEDDEAFCQRAAARNVVIHALSSGATKMRGFYAGFAAYTPATIERAVQELVPLAGTLGHRA